MEHAAVDEPDLTLDLAADTLFLAELQNDRFASIAYTLLSRYAFFKGPFRWVGGLRALAVWIATTRNRGESYLDYFREMPNATLPGDSTGALQNLAWLMNLSATSSENHEEFQSSLKRIKSNEDEIIVARIIEHLARLGWRAENDKDREGARSAALARRVAMLQEIKNYERRPESATPEWAKKICIEHPNQWISSDYLSGLTKDEKEAVFVSKLKDRLRMLGQSGRIEKLEYEELIQELSRFPHV